MISPDSRRALDQAEADLLALVSAYQFQNVEPTEYADQFAEVPSDEYPDIIAIAVSYIVRLAQPAAATSDLFASLLDEMRLR